MCKSFLKIMRKPEELTFEILQSYVDNMPSEGIEKYWIDIAFNHGLELAVVSARRSQLKAKHKRDLERAKKAKAAA